MERVFHLREVQIGNRSRPVQIPEDTPLLGRLIEDHSARLVIIDPIAGCLGSGTLSTNRGARAIIEPLQDLCADSGVSCMMVAHSTKDGKLQGSGGLRDAVRLLYKVAPDPLNPLVRVVSQFRPL